MKPDSKDQEALVAASLVALKEADAPLSGEALAACLGRNRTAVWKQINRLKAMGYVIEGSPRRCYQLLDVPDKLLPGEITKELNTRYLKGPIHYFEALASTNDEAKELGSRDAPEGTLVVAESQTRGRGRLGREWNSPAGVGLYASLLLRPPLPPTEMPQITLATAVAVVRALKRATGVTPGIKWPNDLLVEGKKLGGILTEMETETNRIRYLAVGLGLNVNNREFPPPLHLTATSLARVAGVPCYRPQILQAWLEEFETLYDLFLNQKFSVILEEWREYNVTLGQIVTVQQGPREITGLALDLAEDGTLLVWQGSGEVIRVTSGEITPSSRTEPGVDNQEVTSSS